jgi:hypothetical protein
MNHSERDNKIALPDSKFYIQFSQHNVYCSLGEVKYKEEEVTEGWKVLYKEYLHDFYCLPNCTGWWNKGE